MTKPNLILLMTDQQRFDTIGAMGFPHMVTPNLDALAGNAVRFRAAYCAGATCVASRAALFTGLFAHNTGAYTFSDWGHHRTWVQDLADAGYWCASIGKMHLQPRDVSGGFHERIVVENPTSTSTWGGNGDDAWGRYLSFHGRQRPNDRHRSDPDWAGKFQALTWDWDARLHSDIFIGDSAEAWIRAWDGAQPLFLQVGFTGPHEPWDPLPGHLDLYKDAVLPEVRTFRDDLSSKPAQHQAMKEFHAGVDHESRIDMPNATEADVRTMRRHYFAKISLVDEQIGRVLAALEERGILDNSLLIFCSDHGELLGEHGMAYKWLMYEDIVHVPLLAVPGPGLSKNISAGDVTDLVSLVDIGPTFLEAAGLPIPRSLEGRSLLPAVSGQAPEPSRDMVFCEDNYLIMGRSASRKIVLYLGQEDGEFYDLERDLGEMENLWDDPDSRAERDRLRLRTLEWLASSSYLQAGSKCRQPDMVMRWPAAGTKTLHGPVTSHQKKP